MMNHLNKAPAVTTNQSPHRLNHASRAIRSLMSLFPAAGFFYNRPDRPRGISIYMRVKDEKHWIAASIASIRAIADEIIVVDNGSSDGTFEILQELAKQDNRRLKLWQKPELHHGDLSNFALEQTSFHWVFRWDGDMIAHTDGRYPITELRTRLLDLNPDRYYVIYLRHVNLSGDFFHQDPREMVHIEEYVHTFSITSRFIHPGRYEAVKFPIFYKPLFWYEPYVFHVNIKPARRMLLRYFWEDWMERKDYVRYPSLEDYTTAHIEKEFGTTVMEEAQQKCLVKILENHIPFDTGRFGPYPKILIPLLDTIPYRIQYQKGCISGRTEPE